MVEQNLALDSIFLSLADSTRRDMLRVLADTSSLTVGEIARHYSMTFAGVSKHLKVLEKANLISKTRQGKHQVVSLSPTAFLEVNDFMKRYEHVWNERFDRLEKLVTEINDVEKI